MRPLAPTEPPLHGRRAGRPASPTCPAPPAHHAGGEAAAVEVVGARTGRAVVVVPDEFDTDAGPRSRSTSARTTSSPSCTRRARRRPEGGAPTPATARPARGGRAPARSSWARVTATRRLRRSTTKPGSVSSWSPWEPAPPWCRSRTSRPSRGGRWRRSSPSHATIVPALIETLLARRCAGRAVAPLDPVRLVTAAPRHRGTPADRVPGHPPAPSSSARPRARRSPPSRTTTTSKPSPATPVACGRWADRWPRSALRIEGADADGIGEICSRAAHYFAVDPDGWLRTGDLGRQDDDGFVYLAGRQQDVINRGGDKIHPVEVEQVLARHPAVREVAVAGVADRRLGRVPHAFVVPVDPGEPLDVAAVAGTHASTWPGTRSLAIGTSSTSCPATPPARCCGGRWPEGSMPTHRMRGRRRRRCRQGREVAGWGCFRSAGARPRW